jgi:hypothetical protein
MKKIVAALLHRLKRNPVISSASGRRILASGGLTILAMIGALVFTVHGKLSPAFVCVTQNYSVTSSAPPPIGFWTDTSGAVWSPPGGFPGCAPGDTASDTNPTPTTLIINSAIPNPLIGLTMSCPGCTIDIQSGGSVTLAGTGSVTSSSTIIVEPGGTLTIANGSALTFNSGTALSVNGGNTYVETGGHLILNGASTVTNNGTLNLSGGALTVGSLFTIQPTGTVSVDADTIVDGTNTWHFSGTATLQLDHDLTVGSGVSLNMDAAAISQGTGDVIGSVKRTGFVSTPTPNTLSFGNPDNQITINSGTPPADITVNLVKSTPAALPSSVQRTYTITPNGGSGFSATLRLHYLDGELAGNTPEDSLKLIKYDGANLAVYPPTTAVDTTNDWVETNGVQSFSVWTLNTCAPRVVTNTNDSGAGSLRQALIDACPGSSIIFNIPDSDSNHAAGVYTIPLTTGELAISQSVSITGPNNNGVDTDPIVISGSDTSRVFNISGSQPAVYFSGLTIAHGQVFDSGAAISAHGDGILSLTNCTVRDNHAIGNGGAIDSPGVNLILDGCTFNGNSTFGNGGAVSIGTDTVLISNSTFTQNSASNGGAINSNFQASFTIVNSTIASNSATNGNGGGISDQSLSFTMSLLNTIVAMNSATLSGPDVSGVITSQGYNLIGKVDGSNGFGATGDQTGTIGAPLDPKLGPLQNNGGTTQTMALLTGSPAIDAATDLTILNGNGGSITDTATSVNVADATAIPVGSVIQIEAEQMTVSAKVGNTLTVTRGANLTTAAMHNDGAAVNPAFDGRGSRFPRKADSADVDTTQTVDIGAFELHPSVEDIPNQTTAEDTQKTVTFNVGDDTGALIQGVTATSSNTALVLSDNARLSITGSGGSRTLTITPNAAANSLANGGNTTITVTVTANNGQTATDTFDLTVTEVNTPPNVTGETISNIDEDCATGCSGGKYVIPFATLLANDDAGTNEAAQTITITNVGSAVGGTVAINGTNVEFTPPPDFFGPASFQYTVTDNGTTNGSPDPKSANGTASFTVNAVNDPPSFTIGGNPPASNEDAGAQTVNGFATNISAGPGETGQVLTFNFTPAGTTGTLSFASGPAINTSTGNLTYTANANKYGTATFSVTLSDNGSNTPPNSNTSAPQSFTITVNPVADTPSVTPNPATTNEDTQVTGLVINRNAADSTEVTHFKITNIQHGSLFTGGGTPINPGNFIDFATANAGLKFTPATDYNNNIGAAPSFDVQASLSNTDSGLGGAVVTEVINVTAVNDAPSFTRGADQSVITGAGLQTVNAWATNIAKGPATATDENGQTLNFIVTNNNNALFAGQPAVDASTGNLTYTPAGNTSGQATVSVSLHDNGSGVAPNVNTSAVQTFVITVSCGASNVVKNTNDSGADSLRNAIQSACGGDTITFSNTTAGGATNFFDGNPHTIALTTGELAIGATLTITGPGANVLTVMRSIAAGTPQFRVFNIQSGTIGISNLTISNGRAADGPAANNNGSDGGGILNLGTLLLSNSVVSSNQAGDGNATAGPTSGGSGGGIANRGSLTVRNSIITGNHGGKGGTASGPGGAGGGINNITGAATLNLILSTVSGNFAGDGGVGTAGGSGGGVANLGTFNLVSSTVSGNQTGNGMASGAGGGISNSGTATFINSTISGNQIGSARQGGGVYNASLLTITNCTIVNNAIGSFSSGGGIFAAGGTLNLGNTIVANNTSSGSNNDLSGTINSKDFNLYGNSPGVVFTGTTTHNIANQNPLLGPLANNGGSTQTHLLLPGSPAIDAGGNANLPADTFDLNGNSNTTETLPVDQRGVGFNRTVNTNVDMGAIEANYSITATAGNNQSATINTAFGNALQATVKESNVAQSSIPVTFTPPASGASGAFSGSATVNTNVSGVATAPTFTANGTAGGPYNVVASLANNLATVNFALSNTPANQIIAVNQHAPASAAFNTSFTVAATASSGLSVVYSSSGSCTNVGATFTMTSGAGTCSVIYNQPGNGNFNAAPQVTESVNAQKANQTITFGALANKNYGDADFNVSATASSTLTVSFTSSGQCTISANTVHLTGAGSCTITAKQAGDGNFNAATDVPQSFTIGKAAATTALSSSLNPSNLSQSVTFTATVTGPAGTGTPTGTVAFKDGGNAIACANAGGQTLNASGVATCQTASLTAGTHVITADYGGDANFAVSAGTLVSNQVVNNVPLVSLGAATYNVNEADGVVHVVVNRSGDTTVAFNVDYATSDAGTSNCGALNTGLASAKCDYTTFMGTLKFAANQTTATLDVPITQDAFTEGPESFTVTLSNATSGATLTVPTTATVTISDSTSPAANAIDDNTIFVRQQYHDFLNREPDAAGLAFWVNGLNECNNVATRPPGQTQAQCLETRRILTSSAFFLSIEFMQTGTFVRSFYVAALNRPSPPSANATDNMPGFGEWLRDTQAVQRGVVVGQGSWQATLDANRLAFMQDFVMRPEFVGLYPTTDTPTQYLNKLYSHALSRSPATAELNAGLAFFGGAATANDPAARGQALLQVTQASDFVSREMPRAFVQMEYFGYLRRNPNDPPDNDFTGYNFWLNKLNAFNGDFFASEMVKAFINSAEYRHRFGP